LVWEQQDGHYAQEFGILTDPSPISLLPHQFLSGCQRQGVQVVISLCSNVAGNSAICTGTVYWVRPRVSSWTHVDDEGRIKLVILLVFAVTHEGATDHR